MVPAKAGASPAFAFLSRLVLVLPAVAAVAACSARFDWREARVPDGGFVVALPGRPQTATRTLDFPGGKVEMTMTSAGVGPTLFAVGVARLPAAALAPDQVESTLAWFRHGLLRNVSGEAGARLAVAKDLRLAPQFAAGRTVRGAQQVSQRGGGADGRATQLAARFYVVDDRLYQVAAIGAEGEIPALALETFFDSFRLTPLP